MRLAEFILRDQKEIVDDWEAFAATLLPAAAGLASPSLRDHAPAILAAIAKDLATPQSAEAQSEKSKGRAPRIADAPETAAQTHAVLRAQGGFDINQLVAEYRALRASVLRRWLEVDPVDELAVDDLIRFNEAIDQGVAESVGHFHAYMERSRNLLLGMLGHDMRSPLNTILVTATYLAALNAGDDVSVAADRLIRSGASIRALLDDLGDFNRTNFGLGLKVAPAEIDLAAAVHDELEQVRGAHPDRRIEFAATGDSRGHWDRARVQQMVRNLVSNAIEHGRDSPVRVVVRREEADLWLEVSNKGSIGGAAGMSQLFDPLSRGAMRDDEPAPGGNGLGLGLFIVREIAKSHGGEVDVRADGEEVTFAVRLPRRHPDSHS